MPTSDVSVNTTPASPPTQRVFLALWLPAALADTLSRTARDLTRGNGGRPTRASTMHLTLAFVGDVPQEQVDTLVHLVHALQGTAFRLTLDRVGVWRHNGIAWAGPSITPAPLTALRIAAEHALDRAGLPFDRRPFRPHVTLARRVEHPGPWAMDIGELAWDVTEVVLVRSGRDAQGAARYEVLATGVLETAGVS